MAERPDTDPGSLVGRRIDKLDTPVTLIDLDVFEANARAIHDQLAAHQLTWRPHTKALKSPALARRLLDVGAIGITCAKLSEAEAMVDGGITEILVANHLGSPVKWQRAAALQHRAQVTVCVDDARPVGWAGEAARAAGVTIPLFIEVDIGMRRVGVRSPADAVALAELISATDGVELAGVMGYEGHLTTVWPAEQKQAECEQAMAILLRAADAIRAAGHEVGIVSTGGSATFGSTLAVGGLTECQAGGGTLMDRFYAQDCHVDLPFALTMISTVVSAAEPGYAVSDAGFKALGAYPGMQPPLVLEPSGVQVRALSAEHGNLLTDRQLQVGDRLRLVPGYSDAMMCLHDHVLGVRGGMVTEVIELTGRGKLT